VKFEYLQLPSTNHPVPIEDINRFAKDGWRLKAVTFGGNATWLVIMEREKR